MIDLSDKTALVICSPLFADISTVFAKSFGKVYLYTSWRETFPKIQKGMIGVGLEGVERVDDIFGEHFEEVDIFIFADLYRSATQIYLESIGKRVWGARNGEQIEIYREVCKELMESNGLPLQPWKVVKGLEALRAHLKSNKDQFVKIDMWRGLTETFFAKTYDIISPKLDDLQSQLGPFANTLDFIVEDELPECVETGIDTYCIDGKFPEHCLAGIEVKDLGYVAQFLQYDKMPEQLTNWTNKMAGEFAKAGSRTFMSNEIRIDKKLDAYMIDATIRLPSPPSEIYAVIYKNLAEIVWHGADGVLVDAVSDSKFGVEMIMKSDWAREHYQPISFPQEYRDYIKIFNPCCVDGKYYSIPQDEDMAEIGAIVGHGNTLEDAVDMAMEIADSIEGYGIKKPKGAIDEAIKQIEELDEMGIHAFTLEKAKK